MLQNVQPLEILILVLIVVVLFSARRLPDLLRSIGSPYRLNQDSPKFLPFHRRVCPHL